jgi:hypothetical protein
MWSKIRGSAKMGLEPRADLSYGTRRARPAHVLPMLPPTPRLLVLAALAAAAGSSACSSAPSRVLEVQPDGQGRVYSTSTEHDTLGIDCRSDGKTRTGACVTDISLVDAYTLVAEAAPGTTFDHWEVTPSSSGPATPADPRVTLTVDANDSSTRHVRAVFTASDSDSGKRHK